MALDPIEIAEEFFEAVRKVRALGAGTPETAYYPALSTLLERIGASLSPKVLPLSQLANTGAGSPDFGLFAASQLQKGEPRKGQLPERGVIEVKGVDDASLFTSTPTQLSKYFDAYRLVLVTNLRAFQLVGEDINGQATRLEAFELAENPADFWALVKTPAASAKNVGLAFVEYLKRALTQNVALVQPKDVAWFIASYARDALDRVEMAGELPALKTVRTALEDALGITFEGEKGDHFFRSTLVQTLFYGLFSAWVIWARTVPRKPAQFDWRSAGWSLHVPFIQTLFQQLTAPQHIKQLDLVEVLDWTGHTLNRIDAAEFLKRFDDGEAVQYFYEPFLKAFDPKLRKQFGVWYTPAEVVDYMVARVDYALREELGIADGLADERVYVLDPCCGTGGFVNAVLRRIRANLENHGLGSALADRLRDAAKNRVFGFEIMPAPFVVAHMQAGITLAEMDAPLAGDSRPAIYLTNALTGWEPHTNKPLPFPELEAERASADAIKQASPILVILGNPPYDGFAGISDNAEERALSNAYRQVKKVAPPQGQGLNELYVRFFRMAESRIAEKTGEGVISFISNYSWLDSLSCPGMRERYLDVFDSITVDCLNGDKYKTGKKTPEGLPDPSIFSTPANPAGIQVGTAIATLVRKKDHSPSETISYRDLWGTAKRETLTATAEADPVILYEKLTPSLPMRLQFMPSDVDEAYFEWPRLPELLPVNFAGVKTSRDEFLVDVDREALEKRIEQYFDTNVSNSELKTAFPALMNASSRYDPSETRKMLMDRKHALGEVVRYAYRPFDVRWAYWDPDTKLIDEKRPEFFGNTSFDNRFLTAGERNRMGIFYNPQSISVLGDHHLVESNVAIFPATVRQDSHNLEPNIAKSLKKELADRGISSDQLFDHILATLNAPSYEIDYIDALRIDWPRIPFPGDVEAFRMSAELGSRLSALLDAEVEIDGVTRGSLLAGLSVIAPPRGKSFEVTTGWGYSQRRENGTRLVMPGVGKTTERAWTEAERDALAHLADRHDLEPDALLELIGTRAVDVEINAGAMWESIPENVWEYTLGGYQVLKKWLSYRELDVLGRALSGAEALHFTKTARRITEILCMGPALDAAHAKARDCAVPWIEGKPASN
ncbi:MAG: SAM-dependent methyltransferase [Afipia broomeae]|uniref:type ISP restriction/modification enzyme n=1 Tax=Qipengyuania profunda TaxID=3113984 RepID=UPI002A18A894|nr:type ISP restriction/modification enzyme [Qipengyuania sp. HL-TH1]WPL57397.1 type ISP restriction/modification enzyme [Qipengyuania sp. HL-TH5]